MKLAEKMGCTVGQLAIAWTIANPNTTTAILGATNKKQLNENLAALDVYKHLDADAMGKIDKILGNKPVLPLF
jgi:aryl-alcohol dehydrogenase-like predicted oxidoreductase